MSTSNEAIVLGATVGNSAEACHMWLFWINF